MAKKILLALVLSALLTGCGSSFNPLNPPTVGASGPLPFPSGTIVTLEPGTYACPTGIAVGTHVIGHGSVAPPEMINDKGFAPLPPAAPVVRILCSGDLTLSNLSGVDLSGVIFDFQGTGGLVLDDVAWSRFDIGIVNSTTGLTVQSRTSNNAGNTFPRVVVYETQRGIILQGFNSAVTWNDFGHVDIVRAHDYGINISQFADSNTFHAVRINLYPSATAGVIFNDKGVLADVDASGNVFSLLNCDSPEPGFTGYCADFRGYTVGNQVTMGFGIMPDANKLHFANAFSEAANTVVKLQETPKVP
jgi:hypothetical protein